MLSLPIQLVQLHDPGGEGGGVRGSGSQAFNGHIIIKNDPDGTRTLLLDPSEVGVSCYFVWQCDVIIDRFSDGSVLILKAHEYSFH